MKVNRFAGMGSHQSSRSETDTWITPPALIEALGGVDSFDLDPCAAEGQPWQTARNHFTVVDNGLFQRWFGRVWLNPPYSIKMLARFLGRMAEHDHGIALTFARTETDPFHRFVWGAASGVLFLRGRVNFHYPDGTRSEKNSGAPSVLIAYGEDDRDILAAAPIDGHFQPLRLRLSVIVPALLPTWSEVLEQLFGDHDRPVALGELYRAFADHPKTRGNQHWREKIRQVLQRGQFERVDRGLWRRIPA